MPSLKKFREMSGIVGQGVKLEPNGIVAELAT